AVADDGRTGVGVVASERERAGADFRNGGRSAVAVGDGAGEGGVEVFGSDEVSAEAAIVGAAFEEGARAAHESAEVVIAEAGTATVAIDERSRAVAEVKRHRGTAGALLGAGGISAAVEAERAGAGVGQAHRAAEVGGDIVVQ